MNPTTYAWKSKLIRCLNDPDDVVTPRDMEVRELRNAHYTVPMPAYVNLAARQLNHAFLFGEAWWIVSGSNRLSKITPYMKSYRQFSDDGVFMRGAYGPKFVEQLPYVVDSIVSDNETRQAVMTIWRERPGSSKDIPCTVAAQFLLRSNRLHAIFTMRSQDIVLGYGYDTFTFSMMAKAVQLLLVERGVDCILGELSVNVGSLHLYKRHYVEANLWSKDNVVDSDITTLVTETLADVQTYEGLIDALRERAGLCLKIR